MSAAELARWLGWDDVTEAVLVDRESLSSPARVLFRGVRDGQTVSVTVAGAAFRTELGLKSSNITAIDGVAPPAVDPPDEPEEPSEPADPDSFDDDGGTHEASIDRLAAMGVLEGTGCGERLFCPGEPLQRWVMAVWTVRVRDPGFEPSNAGTRFEDVDPGAWWAGYVERLAELEVTGGCASDPPRYCPDRAVSRAQTASFLVRAFGLEPAEPAGFADTGGTHETNIDALAAVGITKGCAADPPRYCPDQPVTRAQMATLLVRALDRLYDPVAAS